MAPPRNITHLKAAEQKTLRNLLKTIQSNNHTTSPINITQNFYNYPITPPAFYQQFFKHIPPPPPFNTPITIPTHAPPPSTHVPPPSPFATPTAIPRQQQQQYHTNSHTNSNTTPTATVTKFTDYSNWMPENHTKSVGTAPKRKVSFRPEIKLDKSPVTNVNIFKNKAKEKVSIPRNIIKKVVASEVTPRPPPPRYDISGECELSVAINTINTPVTTNAAKPLRKKKEEKTEEPPLIRTIVLSDDYDLEIYSLD